MRRSGKAGSYTKTLVDRGFGNGASRSITAPHRLRVCCSLPAYQTQGVEGAPSSAGRDAESAKLGHNVHT